MVIICVMYVLVAILIIYERKNVRSLCPISLTPPLFLLLPLSHLFSWESTAVLWYKAWNNNNRDDEKTWTIENAAAAHQFTVQRFSFLFSCMCDWALKNNNQPNQTKNNQESLVYSPSYVEWKCVWKKDSSNSERSFGDLLYCVCVWMTLTISYAMHTNRISHSVIVEFVIWMRIIHFTQTHAYLCLVMIDCLVSFSATSYLEAAGFV